MSAFLAQAAALALLPPLLVGVLNRVKSFWAGRRGTPLLQTVYDTARLLRKRPVYSDVSTGLVPWSSSVYLGTAVFSGFLLPILGPSAPFAFPFDFVFFAYCWGLGRAFLILGALDTGSSFEGMGASREATYSAFIEPAFFLAAGALGSASGSDRLCDLLLFRPGGPAGAFVWAGCFVALVILLQVESGRIPVDDPGTHLELTMIHEVMVLDHSGPDLAAVQWASAVKLTLCSAMLSAMMNPLDPSRRPLAFGACNVLLMLLAAAAVGTVESLSARLRLRALPHYILFASAAGFAAVLSGVALSGPRG